MQQIKTFLMFDSKAEEAMNFYVSLFKNSRVGHMIQYETGEPGQEGTVKLAVFTSNDKHFMCIDSRVNPAFGFTPAMSLYVSCKTEEEIDTLFARPSDGGEVMMPLSVYPFKEICRDCR